MDKLILQRQIIKALVILSVAGGIAYKACSGNKIIKKEEKKTNIPNKV